MNSKVLVLTDTHVCEPGRTVFGTDSLQRFAGVVQQAQKDHPDAAHMIICGDIANSGKHAEYEAARQVISQIPCPVTLMLGNHDNRDAFLKVFPQSKTTPEGHVQSLIDIGDYRLITLDTLDGPPFRNDHAGGFLCDDRMAWLRAALAGAGSRRALVFTHHPPYAVGIPKLDEIRLRNDREFLEVLNAAGNVAHIFSGHVHRTISGTVGGLAFSLLRSVVHQLPFELTDFDTDAPVTERGVYGILLLGANSIAMHTEEVCGTTG